MKRAALLIAALAALSAAPASAYYYFTYYLPSGIAPAKFDVAALPNKTVWFFVSENGVWLTEQVPVEFIEFPSLP